MDRSPPNGVPDQETGAGTFPGRTDLDLPLNSASVSNRKKGCQETGRHFVTKCSSAPLALIVRLCYTIGILRNRSETFIDSGNLNRSIPLTGREAKA